MRQRSCRPIVQVGLDYHKPAWLEIKSEIQFGWVLEQIPPHEIWVQLGLEFWVWTPNFLPTTHVKNIYFCLLTIFMHCVLHNQFHPSQQRLLCVASFTKEHSIPTISCALWHPKPITHMAYGMRLCCSQAGLGYGGVGRVHEFGSLERGRKKILSSPICIEYIGIEKQEFMVK